MFHVHYKRRVSLFSFFLKKENVFIQTHVQKEVAVVLR